MIETEAATQRALVVQTVPGGYHSSIAQLDLEEAVGLAHALRVNIEAQEIVTVRDIKAAHYFGSGKIEDLAALIATHDLNLVVVNTQLSPVQQRNLEKKWNVKVIDRTGMILEIFALRAATKEGKLQVELARLAYEKSRLVRTWTHLERQRGGQGFLAGPGETQIESDRRNLDDKMSGLKEDLDQVRRTRALQRTKRKRAPERVVALVGYTNTGKSTLFNRLTEGGVLAKDMLFATLDTTHRILPLPSGQQAVLSDTVGFITDLPTDLIDAFRATLEEVKEADLLIHMRDISDPLTDARKQDVMQILGSLEAGPEHQQPMIEIWNKIDKLDQDEQDRLVDAATAANKTGKLVQAFPLSCRTGFGMDALMGGIEESLAKFDEVVSVLITPKDYKARAWLHEFGDVMIETVKNNGDMVMDVKLTSQSVGVLLARHANIITSRSGGVGEPEPKIKKSKVEETPW